MSVVIDFARAVGRHASAPAAGVMPNKAGSAVFSRAFKASEKTKNNSAGTRPRERQLLTADSPTPPSAATFAVPPSALTISSTVPSMNLEYSHSVESSRSHTSAMVTTCEQCLKLPMITAKDFDSGVAYRLRVLRKALKKSQTDLASKIGVGGTAISNYENGSRAIDPYAAFKLKLLFAVPLEWLYGGEESSLSPALAEKLEEAARLIEAEDAAQRDRTSAKARKSARRG